MITELQTPTENNSLHMPVLWSQLSLQYNLVIFFFIYVAAPAILPRVSSKHSAPPGSPHPTPMSLICKKLGTHAVQCSLSFWSTPAVDSTWAHLNHLFPGLGEKSLKSNGKSTITFAPNYYLRPVFLFMLVIPLLSDFPQT